MRTVTVEQLAAVVEAQQGAQPCTLTTRTSASLLKTGNPYGDVVKYSVVNAFVGVNYGSAVNRQLVREGETPDFVAQPPKWGTRIGKKLISHTGNLYCPVKIGSAIRPPRYVEEATQNTLTAEQIAPFKKVVKSASEAQGVDREIVWRTYKLSNILKMVIGGETYLVVGSPTVESAHRELPIESQEELAIIAPAEQAPAQAPVA